MNVCEEDYTIFDEIFSQSNHCLYYQSNYYRYNILRKNRVKHYFTQSDIEKFAKKYLFVTGHDLLSWH